MANAAGSLNGRAFFPEKHLSKGGEGRPRPPWLENYSNTVESHAAGGNRLAAGGFTMGCLRGRGGCAIATIGGIVTLGVLFLQLMALAHELQPSVVSSAVHRGHAVEDGPGGSRILVATVAQVGRHDAPGGLCRLSAIRPWGAWLPRERVIRDSVGCEAAGTNESAWPTPVETPRVFPVLQAVARPPTKLAVIAAKTWETWSHSRSSAWQWSR